MDINEVFKYHQLVCEHFKGSPKTWNYFSAVNTKVDQWSEYKNHLLKNTYRFDPQEHPEIYEKTDKAIQVLGLFPLGVNVYQENHSLDSNASIAFDGAEVHIVFSGRLLPSLEPDELFAILAHELTHVKFYRILNGDCEIADRIVFSIGNHYSSEDVHIETARRFNLYKEMFCDRGAWLVTGNINPVITSLVKASTSLDTVSAESYLKQAREILTKEPDLVSKRYSHPENYIRALALGLWAETGKDSLVEIEKLIEGKVAMDSLDVFGQQYVADLTRKFLQLPFQHEWMRSNIYIAHAKMFFSDFVVNEKLLAEALETEFLNLDVSVREYLCYILFDFLKLDRSGELVTHGWIFALASELQLSELFDKVYKREFKYSDKQVNLAKEKALASFHEVVGHQKAVK